MKRFPATLMMLAALLVFPSVSFAHFLWLATDEDGKQLHVYFSEAAAADDPALLKYAQGVKVHRLTKADKPEAVSLKTGEESLVAKLKPGVAGDSLFVLQHDLGVMTRGDATFFLRYYAKTGPALGDETWKQVNAAKQLAFDLVPSYENGQVAIAVRWNGKPVPAAEVKVAGPGIDDWSGASDEAGRVAFKLPKPGLYSIRARHVQEKAGEDDGKKYDTVRHYTTLALRIPSAKVLTKKAANKPPARRYPDFPQPVTSFGAAIAGDFVYTYGGHMGEAHTYSMAGQSGTLRRLNLKRPRAWEDVATGPKLQGLAMVSHGGKLYRIGGFTAKNKANEDRSLWSQDDVVCYDPAVKKWTAMPSLPEPRSSHDAAVLGDKIYVGGGWKLAGDGETQWHQTAWSLDLSKESPRWDSLPKPPFERRALALAAHDGKLYVIGGMQREGGPSTRVDVYDPASQKWSQAPSLNGKPFEGFGCSAFAAGGNLYVSTNQGRLQRLSADGKGWQTVQKLERARFFHRMLRLSESQLLSVCGASMKVGKFAEVDVFDVK